MDEALYLLHVLVVLRGGQVARPISVIERGLQSKLYFFTFNRRPTPVALASGLHYIRWTEGAYETREDVPPCDRRSSPLSIAQRSRFLFSERNDK